MDWREEFGQYSGYLHAGLIGTLIDTACGYAAANGVSTLFLEIMGHAPDKRAFLGDLWSRLHPRSWSGSLADILVRRRVAITTVGDNVGGEVRQWVTDMLPELERWIEHESKRDQEDEQSFE